MAIRSRQGGAPVTDLIFGVHPVLEALRAKRRRCLKIQIARDLDRAEIREITALAQEAGIPVSEVEKSRLSEQLGPEARTQGVVMEADPLPLFSLNQISMGGSHHRLIALDGVEDPQNLGAIIRVADTAGVNGLIITEHRSPPLGASVGRVSAGALEHLPISRVTNLSRAIEELKKRDYWVLGASGEGETDLYQIPENLIDGPLLVVFGSEQKGIRPGTRKHIDLNVRIPMQGAVGSLNVSTAAAVFLFELQRRTGNLAGKLEQSESPEGIP